MEFIRRPIEARVLSLTGLAIGGVDYENPPGDPGLFGPDSICWRVHGDFTSMMVGGISALLLQALHPGLCGMQHLVQALCRLTAQVVLVVGHACAGEGHL